MSSTLRVVITDCDLGSTEVEQRILRARLGAHIDIVEAQCRTEHDVIGVARDADALMVQWAPITAPVLASLQRCTVISRYGIGLDMIDLATARERGIAVYNVPHYCTEEVATHAIALLIALWRRLPQLDASLRAHRWEAGVVTAGVTRISGATLGLLGFGRIAEIVGEVFTALGTRVIAYDPYASPRAGVELVSLDELADRADLVSLHCPLTAETRHIVNAAFLGRLNRHAVLVNTARGDLIDAAALTSAMHAGQLAGAGLDVFTDEPLAEHSPLRTMPNTLLSPHASWCSALALPSLQTETAMNVVRHLTNLS